MGQRLPSAPKWHYTTGEKFKQIVADGFIRCATVNVPPNEKPIVWFSTNQEWEPTANKMVYREGKPVRCTIEETEQRGEGLVRFGVAPETAPHDWSALKESSGMSGRMAQGMYQAAIEQGARPGDWW